MKINKIKLASDEADLNIHDFVDGAPLTPEEIKEEVSHYMLEIENANLQRITRHLLRKYQTEFLHFLQQVHIIIIFQVG